MAGNIDTPFGLRPVMYRDGSPYNGAAIEVEFAAAETNAYFAGDPVRLAGSASTFGHRATVGQVTTGGVGGIANTIYGVLIGLRADPDNLTIKHRRASTLRRALITTDPNILFEIQSNGVVLPANVGLNFNLTSATAGSSATGLSGYELDTTSGATSAFYQLKLERLVEREDANTGTNAKCLVSINMHQGKQVTTGT